MTQNCNKLVRVIVRLLAKFQLNIFLGPSCAKREEKNDIKYLSSDNQVSYICKGSLGVLEGFLEVKEAFREAREGFPGAKEVFKGVLEAFLEDKEASLALVLVDKIFQTLVAE